VENLKIVRCPHSRDDESECVSGAYSTLIQPHCCMNESICISTERQSTEALKKLSISKHPLSSEFKVCKMGLLSTPQHKTVP
jgi:hypothetical protein